MKRKNLINAFGNRHCGNRAREVDARVPQGEATFDITVGVGVVVVIVVVGVVGVVGAFMATYYTHNL